MHAEANALHLLRTVTAIPDRVFEAWTAPEQMERWKHPDPTARVEVNVDLRVGGRYSIRLEVDDGHVTAHSTYRGSER